LKRRKEFPPEYYGIQTEEGGAVPTTKLKSQRQPPGGAIVLSRLHFFQLTLCNKERLQSPLNCFAWTFHCSLSRMLKISSPRAASKKDLGGKEEVQKKKKKKEKETV
jgi:hypothetical protein